MFKDIMCHFVKMTFMISGNCLPSHPPGEFLVLFSVATVSNNLLFSEYVR